MITWEELKDAIDSLPIDKQREAVTIMNDEGNFYATVEEYSLIGKNEFPVLLIEYEEIDTDDGPPLEEQVIDAEWDDYGIPLPSLSRPEDLDFLSISQME